MEKINYKELSCYNGGYAKIDELSSTAQTGREPDSTVSH